MRLALYGGTFDPIHHGHLVLARDAIELFKLDRVLFIPAAISPHKLARQPAPAELRRRMVEMAIAGEPRFVLDDRELRREGPSYTIDTVLELRGEMPGVELFYLVGGDNIPQIATWHRFEELRTLVQLVVLNRHTEAPPDNLPSLPRRLDFSSTEIRDRIARGASIRYLVPEPVSLLIEQYNLYRGQPPLD
jgi:nicotinate-nucleotide adenylyltransferase